MSQKVVGYDKIPSTERITTNWSGLNPGETYLFIVKCNIQGIDCAGAPITIEGTTTSCSSMWIFQLSAAKELFK